jgi:hypothetical protein
MVNDVRVPRPDQPSQQPSARRLFKSATIIQHMNSNETVNNAGDTEREPLTDNSVGQQLQSDELSLERLYIELTGANEDRLAVCSCLSHPRRELNAPTATLTNKQNKTEKGKQL